MKKKNIIKLGLVFCLTVVAVGCNNTNQNVDASKVVPPTQDLEFGGTSLTPEEYANVQFKLDSMYNSSNRVVLSDELNNMFRIPDSILSNPAIITAPDFDARKYMNDDQKRLSRLMDEVQVNNLKLIDDKIVVDITKEEFVKKGLPEGYYDYFVQGYNDVNFFHEVSKATPQQIQKNWEEMQAEYRQKLEK